MVEVVFLRSIESLSSFISSSYEVLLVLIVGVTLLNGRRILKWRRQNPQDAAWITDIILGVSLAYIAIIYISQLRTAGLSVSDVIFGLSIGLGVFLSLISFRPSLETHALRMAGVFLIVGLAIQAHNPWVYVASVFLIATTITELDFIENLAAILRGGQKDFWNWKKEMSTGQKRESIASKMEEMRADDAKPDMTETKATDAVIHEANIMEQSADVEKPEASEPPFDGWNPNKVARYRDVNMITGATLDYLDTKYTVPLQRFVEIGNKEQSILVDALLSLPSSDMLVEISLAVKSIRRLELMERMVSIYQDVTKRPAFGMVVFVLPGNEIGESKEFLSQRKSVYKNVVFDFVSFEELGIDDPAGRLLAEMDSAK